MSDHTTRAQCTARTSTTGARCRKAPVKGATVCASHGGNAPQVRAAAARRIATAEAVALAHELGLPIKTTPEQALMGALHQAAGIAAFYGSKVQEIVEDDPTNLVWGHTRTKTGGTDAGDTYEAGPNVWLQLWNDERDRLIRISSTALRLKLTDRQQRLAERQAQLMFGIVMSTFRELNLSLDQIEDAKALIAGKLHALAGVDDDQENEV